MSTLAALHEELDAYHQFGVSPDYYAKQMHRIPLGPVVDRVSYIVAACRRKRVLHLGCSSGPLHGIIATVTESLTGWDSEPYPGTPVAAHVIIDLDTPFDCSHLRNTFDLVVVAEVLEHLGNPGQCLQNLRGLSCPLLITVPNAFSAMAWRQLQGGIENVHRQHTCWYSWKTLTTLLERYGYAAQEFAWYNCPQGAQPQEAEGLILRTQ